MSAACSEVDIEPSPDGGGGEGAGTSTTTSGTTKASTTSTVGTGGAGGAPDGCENVPTYLQNLLDAAAACSPGDPSLHCQDIVDGFCCPVVVESISSPETQAYLDFLALTQDMCPEMWQTCNAVDCAFPMAGNCVPDARGGGMCQGHP
ncbi:MAG: hypothetical protein HOV80_07925 [Polyangiaceae bacterium]|nr:hypothetical protein [Polyangiaceae bacterium]